jgi:hypothetical protein
MQDLLNNCQRLLAELEKYHGCGNKIRDALSNSTNNQLQIAAYNEVCPNIELILSFYNISNEIGLSIGCFGSHLPLSPISLPPIDLRDQGWGTIKSAHGY